MPIASRRPWTSSSDRTTRTAQGHLKQREGSGRREGSLEAPTRHPIDWNSPDFYNEDKVFEEMHRVFDICLVLHADHGYNASTFSARVTASTLSDLHSAIVSAIGTLKGPRHGGAAEAVRKMTAEIGEPGRADAYIKRKLDNHERIMGFGHAVYKTEDPRARHMRDKARSLGQTLGHPEWYQILQQVEKDMQPYQARGIYVNVDFFAGAVYALLGLPEDLSVPIFAIGRMPGWCVEILEQYENNMLIRPLLQYVGPKDLPYVPIDER